MKIGSKRQMKKNRTRPGYLLSYRYVQADKKNREHRSGHIEVVVLYKYTRENDLSFLSFLLHHQMYMKKKNDN